MSSPQSGPALVARRRVEAIVASASAALDHAFRDHGAARRGHRAGLLGIGQIVPSTEQAGHNPGLLLSLKGRRAESDRQPVDCLDDIGVRTSPGRAQVMQNDHDGAADEKHRAGNAPRAGINLVHGRFGVHRDAAEQREKSDRKRNQPDQSRHANLPQRTLRHLGTFSSRRNRWASWVDRPETRTADWTSLAVVIGVIAFMALAF
jgi:hypothetical protein